MTLTGARRFARVAIEQHCHEGVFDLSFQDPQDLESVGAAVTELGYQVSTDAVNLRLTVFCSPTPAGV